jgi:hypothetical protein
MGNREGLGTREMRGIRGIREMRGIREIILTPNGLNAPLSLTALLYAPCPIPNN